MNVQLSYLSYALGTFNDFLLNLSKFINIIFEKFKKKFYNNKLSLEDYHLLEDFLLFLSVYKFNDFGFKYISIWNDSFYDLSLEEKNKITKINSNENINFEIKNNKLFVNKNIYTKLTYNIDEIDNYSFEPLIEYLRSKFQKPNYIELNK